MFIQIEMLTKLLIWKLTNKVDNRCWCWNKNAKCWWNKKIESSEERKVKSFIFEECLKSETKNQNEIKNFDNDDYDWSRQSFLTKIIKF